MVACATVGTDGLESSSLPSSLDLSPTSLTTLMDSSTSSGNNKEQDKARLKRHFKPKDVS